MREVVGAAGGREGGPPQLLGQVARVLVDVVGVGGDAVGDSQQAAEAKRVESSTLGEVGVDVAVALGPDPQRGRRQRAQRPGVFLGGPAAPLAEVAQAAQRMPKAEPRCGRQLRRDPVVLELARAELAGRPTVGALRPRARLEADRVAERRQLPRLGGDEGLRERREGVAENQHRGAAALRRQSGEPLGAVAEQIATAVHAVPPGIEEAKEGALPLPAQRPVAGPAERVNEASRQRRPRRGSGIAAVEPGAARGVAAALAFERPEGLHVAVLDRRLGAVLQGPAGVLDPPADLDVGSGAQSLVEAADGVEGAAAQQQVRGDPGRPEG